MNTVSDAPDGRVRVSLIDEFQLLHGNGVAVRFFVQGTGGMTIWTPGGCERQFVPYGDREVDGDAAAPLRLGEVEARALRDALNQHFGDGATPETHLRQDYLAERGRVDSLLKVVSVIAAGVTSGDGTGVAGPPGAPGPAGPAGPMGKPGCAHMDGP